MAIQFEGPEKKLEIILSRPLANLRSDADARWEAVVHACGAAIISRKQTSEMDAFLLSESSLFIWKNRILMITCGRTTLARSVPLIIERVGRDNIAFFFYERKNVMYPHLQSSDFEGDVEALSEYFEGKSYRLGPANHDHVQIYYACRPGHRVENDATLEILMHDLHPDAMAAFIPDADASITEMEQRTGIGSIYPEMARDSYLFRPYGYSLNKIVSDRYATIHVTPEKNCSYASFETNVPEADYSATISRVLTIFRPHRFSLVMTESDRQTQPPLRDRLPGQIAGYRRTETSSYAFDCGFAVSFRNNMRNGEQPRGKES